MRRVAYLVGLVAIGWGGIGPQGIGTAQESAEYTFGTTVASTTALQGNVYMLKPGAKKLPQFEKLKPLGSIYTTSLNIWPQFFNEGFPGVTERQEWFAIDYTGKFWIEQAGTYRFSLLSDDGSKLWIDDQMVINLDGEHPPSGATVTAQLSRGTHRMRVAYYQGPAYGVALVLAVAPPKAPYRSSTPTTSCRPRTPPNGSTEPSAESSG